MKKLGAGTKLINDGDTQLIILSAVRYAMGRQTYIVSVTCDWVRHHWNIIDDRTRELIKRDINEAIAEHNRKGQNDGAPWTGRLGMEMDYKDWVKLSEWIGEQNNGNRRSKTDNTNKTND